MDDEDEDLGEYILQPHRASWWMVAGAALGAVEDAVTAVAGFFGSLSLMSLAHYKHLEVQRELHDQATREIEMMTQGD